MLLTVLYKCYTIIIHSIILAYTLAASDCREKLFVCTTAVHIRNKLETEMLEYLWSISSFFQAQSDASAEFMPSSDPTANLIPNKPKDFIAFINLVDFCRCQLFFFIGIVRNQSIKQTKNFLFILIVWDCIHKIIVILSLVTYCLQEILSILPSGCIPCVTSSFCSQYISLWSAAFISSSPCLWELPRKSTIFR